MDAEKLLAQIDAKKATRAELMPTERDAIRAMHEAHQRLRELGWQDGRPTVADHERFAGIQCGSTGIHSYHVERRPNGPPMFMIYDGDMWPTYQQPALWRPWKDTDVQQKLRICAPLPADVKESSDAR